jgi:hypothetical protein
MESSQWAKIGEKLGLDRRTAARGQILIVLWQSAGNRGI